MSQLFRGFGRLDEIPLLNIALAAAQENGATQLRAVPSRVNARCSVESGGREQFVDWLIGSMTKCSVLPLLCFSSYYYYYCTIIISSNSSSSSSSIICITLLPEAHMEARVGDGASSRKMPEPERDWIAKARDVDEGCNREMFIPIMGTPWQMTGIWRSNGIADALIGSLVLPIV